MRSNIRRAAGIVMLVAAFSLSTFAQAVTTRTITGTIRKPDGSAWVGAKVTFELTKNSYTTTTQFPASIVTATTNASGQICVAPCTSTGVTLWTNAEGLAPAQYKVTYPDGAYFYGTLAPGAALGLSTWRASSQTPGTPPNQAILQSIVDAHAGAKASASQLGHVRVGSGLSIDSDGILSATGGGGEGGVTAHSELTGLDADDHPQYLTNTRGDARYYTQSALDVYLAQKAPLAHTHSISDVMGLQAALDAKAASAHTHAIADTTGLQAALDTKLTEAQADVRYAASAHSHANATSGAAGFMSSGDKAKLDGIASGATANSSDAQLRDRSTHTGAQAISTVTGLQSALDAKAASMYLPRLAFAANDVTTTSTSFVDITGLSIALEANKTYVFRVGLSAGTSADVSGTRYTMQFSAAGASLEAQIVNPISQTNARAERLSAFNTAPLSNSLTTSAQTGAILITGRVVTGSNAGDLTVRHLKNTSGTATIYAGSFLEVTLVQ